MESPRIYLLGSLQLHRGQRRLPEITTARAKSLLAAVLLADGSLLHRYLLSAELWPHLPADAARKAFDREYWRLREYFRSVDLNPDNYFCSDSNLIGLAEHAPYWLDASQFRQALTATAATVPEEAGDDLIAQAVAAVALYRGELLEGCRDPWCSAQRRSLQTGLTHLLEFLMRTAMARAQWPVAVARGRQILAWNPHRQPVHDELMRCALDHRPAIVPGHAA